MGLGQGVNEPLTRSSGTRGEAGHRHASAPETLSSILSPKFPERSHGSSESWPFLFQALFRQQGVMHLRTKHFQAHNVKDPTARQMN